ncbi:hypothetical protein GGI12_000564 [Dipsacomyces acuminosporus]|nr:hypothetical protein GGI12_000564 [Dipsacomyces acuminosporus]
MLAYAAAKRASASAATDAARQGISKAARATYQTYSSPGSPLGRNPRFGSRWLSKLLAYLRGSTNAIMSSAAKTSTGRAFAKTAAARLHAAMPKGPGWISRFAAKAPTLARTTSTARLGARGYLRAIAQAVGQHFGTGPSTSRLAGRWAFGVGGRWAPYAKTFAQRFSTASSQHHLISARVIIAQIQRQAMAGVMTQQRKDLALISPFAHETRIGLLSHKEAQAADVHLVASHKSASAAQKLAICKKNSNKATSSADAKGRPDNKSNQPHLHQVALDAQSAAGAAAAAAAAAAADIAPIEQCVTITIPYVVSGMGQVPAAGQNVSSADVAQRFAQADKHQQRHALLLNRLLERISATGWNVRYQYVSSPAEGIQIALPPSSGISTGAALESLLCDWGIDTAHLAAAICEPSAPLAARAPIGNPPSRQNSRAQAQKKPSDILSPISSEEFDDIDSRLFSLIVNEVVDPEEAYREGVMDFLAELERMPRLSLLKHHT